MAWAEVFAEAVPTLMEIVDDRFTQYRERSEARKKWREITGGGVGASLAMGRAGPQILKPGPNHCGPDPNPTRPTKARAAQTAQTIHEQGSIQFYLKMLT